MKKLEDMTARWEEQEEHCDTTLDYAISEIYTLATTIDTLTTEVGLQLIIAEGWEIDAMARRKEIHTLTTEVEGLKADYATALRRERSRYDQNTRTYKELKQAKAENKDLKAALEEMTKNMQHDAVQGRGEWETGMYCGLEDRGIMDRYEACRYGHDEALNKVEEWVIGIAKQALESENRSKP